MCFLSHIFHDFFRLGYILYYLYNIYVYVYEMAKYNKNQIFLILNILLSFIFNFSNVLFLSQNYRYSLSDVVNNWIISRCYSFRCDILWNITGKMDMGDIYPPKGTTYMKDESITVMQIQGCKCKMITHNWWERAVISLSDIKI